MNWYYIENGVPKGSVSDDAFEQLVRAGTIAAQTLVWQEGMSDWLPHARVLDPDAVVANRVADGAQPPDTVRCVECRGAFTRRDMVSYGERLVCASCRDVFFQKVREGVDLPLAVEGVRLRYAGFWIRAGAKLIDSVALYLINIAAIFLFGLMVSVETVFRAEHLPFSSSEGLLLFGIQTAIGLMFAAGFIGGLGATPGKLALGLRVVRPDGARVGFARAFGRASAEYLSSFILGFGYIQAAGDDEKRTLHDRLCGTRVVRN